MFLGLFGVELALVGLGPAPVGLGLALVVFEMALTAATQGTAKHAAEPRQRPATDEAMGQDLDQLRSSVSRFTMKHLTRDYLIWNFGAVSGQDFEARRLRLSAKI